jgi:hypothetical protein
MPESKRRNAAPHCELGVTGKRLRRALPTISPPVAFRTALKEAICGRPDERSTSHMTPMTSHPKRA